ncbi:hypothetical protein [Clostridium estertheticum]|nr:hypothetical protein [Clostridium estertheticum]
MESARHLESARPETSHNKMLTFALAGESFEEWQAIQKSYVPS